MERISRSKVRDIVIYQDTVMAAISQFVCLRMWGEVLCAFGSVNSMPRTFTGYFTGYFSDFSS